MLTITIPGIELYDETICEFVSSQEQTIQLEHSLVSLSKWESKWCKPYLSKEQKTNEQAMDYVKFMTITQNVNPKIYDQLSDENVTQIRQYIDAPMTATTFTNNDRTINRDIITAEIIYYWMVTFNIPFDPCQKWHLTRLLTLINVCNIKNQPPKKMSKRETMSRNTAMNAARRQAMNTTG